MSHLGHFLAFELGGDQSPHIFLILVAILLRVKRSRKALDQLLCEFLLLLFHLDLVGWNRLGGANFVRIEHRVQGHAFATRANNHDVLALVHSEFCDGSVAGFLHGLHQELISLNARVFRRNVIRCVKVQWIHLIELHKLQNFHDFRGRRLDLVQLFFVEQDVLVFFVLVALHDFRAFHIAITDRAEQRLLEPRVTFLMKLVKTDAFAPSRRKHADRHRNQAKSKVTFPNRRGHRSTPSIQGWVCASLNFSRPRRPEAR